MREFLERLGVPPREVKLLGYWAEKVRMMAVNNPELQRQFQASPQFSPMQLPPDSLSLQEWGDLGCDELDYLNAIEYLLARGDDAVAATTYYWTPETKYDLNRRLIIPCYQNNYMIGWTARSVDPELQPRYHKDVPTNLLFNIDLLTMPHRKFVFVVEGVFDALVIEGVAALGSMLNDQQIVWIKQSDKQVIVVPDRDSEGSRLTNIALEQAWAVATPHYGKHQWWDADIKDAADAVQRYGKLYTLQSIIATSTSDAGQIRQRTSYRIG